MNIIKKLYPYTIIIAFILYSIIMEKAWVIFSSPDLQNSFLFFLLVFPLIGVVFGMVLDLSSRSLAPLKLKLNFNYLVIAFIFIFILYSPYTSFGATVLNIVPILTRPLSTQTSYILAIIIGYFLSKGLISTKNNSDVRH